MKSFLERLRRGEIGAAAIVVAAGILLSRILGILRDMIFAGMLGSSGITDEYVAAFRIPDYANYLLAGGFLTITFIPIFSKYLAMQIKAVELGMISPEMPTFDGGAGRTVDADAGKQLVTA